MRHPSDGTIRRLLDEPAGVADADRQHVAGCPTCRADVAAAAADASAVGTALHVAHAEPAPAAVDRAWSRLTQATAVHERPRAAAAAAPGRRWQRALRSPVAAAVGVVALLGGASAAAAGDWLQIFRTEEIAPVTVTSSDLVELPDLSAYGALEVLQAPDVQSVDDAAAAAEVTGLAVPEPSRLPDGVTGSPAYRVSGQASALFPFSTADAARSAEAAGEPLPTPPPGLEGSSIRIEAGPGLAAVWQGRSGLPALAVGRAVAPTAYSDGVPFETARDYLLSLPGLPADVAEQLRNLSGDGSTLPLPVPAEMVTSSTTDLDGTPATVLTSRDGTMSGVVWVEDGVVTGVAGSLGTDEVLAVARELHGS